MSRAGCGRRTRALPSRHSSIVNMFGASIAAKFAEGSKALPIDQLMETSNKKTLTALTPGSFSMAYEDGGVVDEAPAGTGELSSLTHDEMMLEPEEGKVSFQENILEKIDQSKPSVSLGSMDRLAFLQAMMKQQETVRAADSNNASSDTKRAYNRVFFSSPPEGRTESDLHGYDETFFSNAQACQPLTKSARFSIASMASLRSVQPDSIVFRAGENQACVFFVLTGSLEVESQDGSVRVINEGQSLGSFPEPPSYNQSTPRTRQPLHLSPLSTPLWTETCQTTEQTTELVVLSLAQWSAIVTNDPFCYAHRVASFLEDLPVFSILSRAQIETLAKIVRFSVFRPGSIVFQQGSEGEEIFVIKSGFVRVVRDCHLEDKDRQRFNTAFKDNLDLEDDIMKLATPRSKGDRPKSKLPPSFLDRVPPSPVGAGSISGPQISNDSGPSSRTSVGKKGSLSASEKLAARIRDVEVRSLSGAGSLSSKRLGGGLTPRDTEQGTPDDDKEPGTISLPPLDFSKIGKTSRAAPPVIRNEINNSTLYSPKSPKTLDRNPFVLIELANLGSGRIFGDTRSYSIHSPPEPKTRLSALTGQVPIPTRPFSAVCDTSVEAFQISKSDALSKIGPDIEFLWLPDGGETSSAQPSAEADHNIIGKSKMMSSNSFSSLRRGSFITPVVKQTRADVIVKDDLQKKIQWEKYKKNIIRTVFEDRAARTFK